MVRIRDFFKKQKKSYQPQTLQSESVFKFFEILCNREQVIFPN